jgi:glycosyltransferase involved in cell wall biosynthesis
VKILFLSSHAHWILDERETRTSGGAELQVALLARELASIGHEVVIAAGDTGQADGGTLQGVHIRNAGKFQTGRMGEMLGAAPRVFSVIREERPDWVVVMGWTAWLFLLWLWRPLLGYRLDFICALDSEINGAFVRENPVLGRLFDFAVRRADARHAITREQREVFEKRGMAATLYRYLVFPRSQGSRPEKTVDFLWVSRCQPIKRPHRFLELAEALPEFRFEMICPAENRGLWVEISARAKRIANLIFIESVPYHEIQGRYDAARVFVNTSEWEGWPNSFIQAGLGRTALLSLDVNPDGIFERFGLGVFADGDFEKLKLAARRIVGDAVALERMQEGCARFVAEMHDNRKETEAFLAGLSGRP